VIDGQDRGDVGQKELTVLLHNLKELDDDLRARSDQHLSFSTLFGIGDVLEAVSQNAHTHHLEEVCLSA